MNIKYLSVQIKQFMFASIFFLLAITGISVSNSFDQTYMARVANHSKMEAKILASEKLETKSDEVKDKKGVALVK